MTQATQAAPKPPSTDDVEDFGIRIPFLPFDLGQQYVVHFTGVRFARGVTGGPAFWLDFTIVESSHPGVKPDKRHCMRFPMGSANEFAHRAEVTRWKGAARAALALPDDAPTDSPVARAIAATVSDTFAAEGHFGLITTSERMYKDKTPGPTFGTMKRATEYAFEHYDAG